MFDHIKRLPPLTVITAELILLSAGAFAATAVISHKDKSSQRRESLPEVKAELIDSDHYTAALTDTGSIERVRAVRITDGEGYVRFRIELLDSDGIPLSDKLKQKQADIEVFKGYLTDPEMPSYEAFNDAYHRLMNEQLLLKLKAGAALSAFCDAGGSPLPQSEDILKLDSEDGCSCTMIYRKKLSAGDTAELYSSICVPADSDVSTSYEGYIKNDDNSYRTETLDAGVTELLGTGFGIHVTVETIPSDGSDTAYTAFLRADEESGT